MDEQRFSLGALALISALSLAGFLGLWAAAVHLLGVDPYILPPPEEVLRLGIETNFLAEHIWISTRRVLTGFVMAVLIATPIGLVMGVNRWVRAIFNPLVSLIRPLPSMSWIPLSIIWFGLGEQQKGYIVFMGCFASVLVYTVETTLQVDPTLRLAARNLGASRRQEIFRVMLPAAMPNLISGLKVIMAVAWTCVISAEMVGASKGLGYQILWGKDVSSTSLVFLGMFCISLTVLLLDVAFRGLEWLLIPHKRGKR